jgi:hypothetical protein
MMLFTDPGDRHHVPANQVRQSVNTRSGIRRNPLGQIVFTTRIVT